MPLCRAGLGVWLILASLAACAQDDEAAAARAARGYCRALAMERYDLAWDLLTEETRNWYRECAEGQRRPEGFRAWEERFGPVRTSALPAGPPATPEALFRDDVPRRLPPADLWSGWLEEPRVLVRKDGTALAGWPGGRWSAVLVRQRGRFRVDRLGGDCSDFRDLDRSTEPGPFGRDLASWFGLFVARPPIHLRPPRLPGVPIEDRGPDCWVWVDRWGTRCVQVSRCDSREQFLEMLFYWAEHARDEPDPMRYSLIRAVLHADHLLTWREAWEVLLDITAPAVRFRDLFVVTDLNWLPPVSWRPPEWPFEWRGIPFRLSHLLLTVKVRHTDARVEIAVGPEDVRAGRLAQLPGVWAAVPEERKVEGVRLILDGDLTFEDALRAILAAAALNPARIVLGARAEIDPEIEPVTLDLATAPAVEPPPAPAPFPWPIPLTIHHGERPAEWFRDRR